MGTCKKLFDNHRTGVGPLGFSSNWEPNDDVEEKLVSFCPLHGGLSTIEFHDRISGKEEGSLHKVIADNTSMKIKLSRSLQTYNNVLLPLDKDIFGHMDILKVHCPDHELFQFISDVDKGSEIALKEMIPATRNLIAKHGVTVKDHWNCRSIGAKTYIHDSTTTLMKGKPTQNLNEFPHPTLFAKATKVPDKQYEEMKTSLSSYLRRFAKDSCLNKEETDELVRDDCIKKILACCFNISGPKTQVILHDEAAQKQRTRYLNGTSTGRPERLKAEAQKERLVHFANSLEDMEEGKVIQSKSMTDMVAFMKEEFPDKCKGKTDQQIKEKIIIAISKEGRVCAKGPFVAYSSDDLVEVLNSKTSKKAQKKGTHRNNFKICEVLIIQHRLGCLFSISQIETISRLVKGI